MRAVFTLRDVEEFSVAETATILGLSEAAVKTALHRARLLLRESLASYFQERCQPKRSTRDHKGEGAQ
jgi:RNA polymerase sigma-70 factor (ECF subfamily)